MIRYLNRRGQQATPNPLTSIKFPEAAPAPRYERFPRDQGGTGDTFAAQ